ncbi:MAG: Rne/Rng family ribonuclease [Myxococcota bacterium]|jgi:ribonuclease G|nr:Rne/Rng family ribonuclease [Myxococcota bacterium]
MSESIIVINADVGDTRVAIIEGGMIVELLIERYDERSLVGNVYKGKVTRVLPGMQAAFVDIGLERNAFLHASDVLPPDDDDDEDGSGHDLELEASEPEKEAKTKRSSKRPPIEDLLREGESVVVQVSKGPISTKGARVTTHVSLAGRHLVYMPTSERGGVSRRISEEAERRRLVKILSHIAPSRGALIARTVSAGVSADALAADASYLSDMWSDIVTRNTERKNPGLLREELDLPLRIARDRLNDSVAEVVVDDKTRFDRLYEFIDRLMPSRLDSVRLYEGDEPVFDAFGIEAEIKRALERRVALPSGGYLIIDQAEALTAIDVNTGSFVGKGNRDQEETILATNLEAVDEIAYQLRFRNIGGLIVLDLIDMDRMASRRKVLARLKELLKGDRAKASVVRISEFGLVEMTRERTSDSLGRILHEPCPHCEGTGQILSRSAVASEALRDVRRRYAQFKGDIEMHVHPNVAEVLRGKSSRALAELEERIGRKIKLVVEGSFHEERHELRSKRGTAPKEVT